MPNVPKTTDSKRNMERASGNCCCPMKCSLSCKMHLQDNYGALPQFTLPYLNPDKTSIFHQTYITSTYKPSHTGNCLQIYFVYQ